MAQVASGGGWQTTFTLVNLGTSSAQVQLSFFDNNGNELALPLTFVQSGATMTASTLSKTIARGGTLVILTGGSTALVGSAQLSTPDNVSGFAIFRYQPTGQEAVVPLETRSASRYVLAFDNMNGVATGVALATSSSQPAIVQALMLDDSGQPLGADLISLAGNGHTSFMLAQDYAVTAHKRGTVEFQTISGGPFCVLGLRGNGSALTTLPVLSK
jgi:hypothetical protein